MQQPQEAQQHPAQVSSSAAQPQRQHPAHVVHPPAPQLPPNCRLCTQPSLPPPTHLGRCRAGQGRRPQTAWVRGRGPAPATPARGSGRPPLPVATGRRWRGRSAAAEVLSMLHASWHAQQGPLAGWLIWLTRRQAGRQKGLPFRPPGRPHLQWPSLLQLPHPTAPHCWAVKHYSTALKLPSWLTSYSWVRGSSRLVSRAAHSSPSSCPR